MKTLSIIALLILFSGCAFKDTGKVDYRKAIINEGVKKETTESCKDCQNETYLKLIKKDRSFKHQNSKFVKGEDRVSFHLKTAYIKDFTESFSTLNEAYNATTKGEIAIVANVFELQRGTNTGLNFSDMKQGRVVYFDDDVEKQQTLNFNNMPIYGPKLYDGNPIAFRLSIIELDRMSQYSKNIMSNLAQVGGRSFPASSQILSLLNTFGQAFANADSDDIIFRYSAFFDAKNGFKEGVNHTVLEAGYYVFVKENDRDKDIKWQELCLNTNNHLLYESKDGNCSKNFSEENSFKEKTYLVIEINKNVGDQDIDLETNNFNALRDNLERMTQSQREDANKLTEAFSNTFTKISQKENFKIANALLDKLIINKSLEKNDKNNTAYKFINMIKDSSDTNNIVKVDGKLNANSIEKLLDKIILNSKDENAFMIHKIKHYKTIDDDNVNESEVFKDLINLK